MVRWSHAGLLVSRWSAGVSGRARFQMLRSLGVPYATTLYDPRLPMVALARKLNCPVMEISNLVLTMGVPVMKVMSSEVIGGVNIVCTAGCVPLLCREEWKEKGKVVAG